MYVFSMLRLENSTKYCLLQVYNQRSYCSININNKPCFKKSYAKLVTLGKIGQTDQMRHDTIFLLNTVLYRQNFFLFLELSNDDHAHKWWLMLLNFLTLLFHNPYKLKRNYVFPRFSLLWGSLQAMKFSCIFNSFYLRCWFLAKKSYIF